MGQLENVREGLRRAYESGRDSARQAREQAETVAESDGPPELPPDPPALVVASPARRDDDVPRGLRIAAGWTWRLLLLGIGGAAVLWVVGRLQVVVVPIAIAILLSALLSPPVARLRRAKLPASLATTVVLITGLAAVGGTLYLVITQLVRGIPELAPKAAAGLEKIETWLKDGPLNLSDDQLQGMVREAREWLEANQSVLAGGALSTATTLGHLLTGLFLVLFTTFFFLRDGRRISRFVIGLLPGAARGSVAGAADASWTTLVSYVRATVLVAFIDAVGIGIALVILDVPFPFPLAALVFIGAFVPIVGATISGAVAVLIALVDRGPVVALILLAAVIGVQQLEGHVLQPIIMGRAVAIHPLAVILAIAAGIVLAGIIGALVAVPIVAVLNTAIRYLTRDRAPAGGVAEATGPPDGPEPDAAGAGAGSASARTRAVPAPSPADG